jgi:hypothetical protein
VGNNPINAIDPLGLDRVVYGSFHEWIEVDTYDVNGKKAGRQALNFAPEGNHPSYTIKDPWDDNFKMYTRRFREHIPSSREADEDLLKLWADLKARDSERWNGWTNCRGVTQKYKEYGIPQEELNRQSAWERFRRFIGI